jgi:hypothetical protein
MTDAQSTQLAAAYQKILDQQSYINNVQNKITGTQSVLDADPQKWGDTILNYGGTQYKRTDLQALNNSLRGELPNDITALNEFKKAYDVLQSSISQSNADNTAMVNSQAALAAAKSGVPAPATTLAQSNTKYLIYGSIALVIVVIAILVLRKKYAK